MTVFNVSSVFKITNDSANEETYPTPATTNEYPIESFVQIRVEMLLEIEQDISILDCSPNMTCPKIKFQFPKTTVSSGIIVWSNESNTLILTAGHSCENDPPESIKLIGQKTTIMTGHGHPADAVIFKVDKEGDLCILRVTEYTGPPMTYTNKRIPLHTKVLAMASPLGLGSPFAIPVFEGRYFGDVDARMSTYGFPSAPGSSGGPVFTKDKKLVGIITRVATGFHHFSIATTQEQTSIFLDKNIALFKKQLFQDSRID